MKLATLQKIRASMGLKPENFLYGRYYLDIKRICTECERDKGSTSMPCPYCHPSKFVPPKRRAKGKAIIVVQATFVSRRDPRVKYHVYVDKRTGMVSHCTCPGFHYRGTCRHTDQVKERRDKRKNKSV